MILNELIDELNFFGFSLFWILGNDLVNFVGEGVVLINREA